MKDFKKGLIYAGVLAFCIGFGAYIYCNSIKKKIPDKLYIYKQDKAVFSMDIPVVGTVYDSSNNICADNIDFGKQVTIQSGNTGQYYVDYKLFGLLSVARTHMEVVDEKYIYSGGFQVGIYLKCNGVYVVNTETICTYDGQNVVPAKGKINKGDYIIKVNGSQTDTKEQLLQAVSESAGNSMDITVRRDGQEIEEQIIPVKNVAGEYKIGIWVKDDTQGVGTVTYVCEDGTFAALGHGISDIDTEKIVDISSGELITANILSIKKGVKGPPGEIRGTIENGYNIGTISKNTNLGVYGTVTNKNYLDTSGYGEMEVATRSEIQDGKAQIVCQLDNSGKKTYEIEIEKIYLANNTDNKSMLIKVTDKELLEKTGGIIQGMSGAPVIQNGKFIGAVTNVLVNDPTQGYAIFADMMIKQIRSVD